MQLAFAMSLSAHEATGVTHASNAATPPIRLHSSHYYVQEDVIDLRSDDEADDAGVGETTASLDARQNPAWSSTAAATQQTGYRHMQRRASHSISDATIERLTGLRLA